MSVSVSETVISIDVTVFSTIPLFPYIDCHYKYRIKMNIKFKIIIKFMENVVRYIDTKTAHIELH